MRQIVIGDKMKKNIIFILFLVPILFIGCGPSVYIQTQIDPEFSFSHSDKIFIYLRETPTLTEKNFYNLLKHEMENSGFQIVYDAPTADKILFFSLDEKTSDISSFYSLPTTTTTTGKIGNTKYKETTSGTTTVPYTYSYTVKKVYLDLYDVKSAKEGNYTPVWEGYIGAGRDDYEKYTNLCIRKLLEYYGQNFGDHVKIK
ncbi:MAG: hypothetical protein IT277_04475 [Ignavibacteriaceae bacterium]|jgi:hypothetical protein|nr:hypothetical protein [Ignavibacteriaceae bacterium]